MKHINFMRIRLQFLFLAFCVVLQVAGQDIEAFVPQGYSLIPPAPEAAALMGYVETPVSPFTGQPAINLPLYTLRQGALELPVSVKTQKMSLPN